ncbi:MAG: DUF2812 domain-containing protein [Oscillospiraceae bacterium]|nr:DUF2812 domain-containing protein [Oscillospiraceae bacterium]
MGLKYMQINKYEPAADEKRLEEFAAKGEFISSQCAGIAVFRKGGPKKMRYCIEADTHMPRKKKLAAYKECGWSFAARATDANIYCTEDENAVPLHTDRSEYAHVIETFHRSSLIMFVVFLLMLVALYAGMFIFYNVLDYSVLYLLEYDLKIETRMLISSAVATVFIGMLMIIYLVDVIRAGQFIAGCIENKKSAAKSVAANAVMIACAVLMLVISIGDILFHWYCGLVNSSRQGDFSELPDKAITAEDFVELAPHEVLAAEGWLYVGSSLTARESALTDTYCEYDQFEGYYNNSGETAAFSVNGEYYEFKSTLAAKIAVDELADFWEGIYEGYNISVKEHNVEGTAYDRIISITNFTWDDVTFFVRQGKVVQCVKIYFNDDFSDTETIYQKLIEIE